MDLDITGIAIGAAFLIVFTAVFTSGRPKHEGEAATCERERLVGELLQLRRALAARRNQEQEKRKRGCSVHPTPRIGKVTPGPPIRYNGLVDPLLS